MPPAVPSRSNFETFTSNLIVLGEEQYPEGELTRHKWRLEKRARQIAEIKRQMDEVDRKERDRIAALEKACVAHLLGEASALHEAEQIRAYVNAVEQRLKLSPTHVKPN